MSSTHRYQSRFFQTLQSQFRQLQDNLQLHWRQLKVAVAWGTQLSLYPLYVIFQAGRWGGRVLKHHAAQGMRSLSATLGIETSPEIDQPIRTVLAAIQLQPEAASPAQGTTAISARVQQTQEWQISIHPAAKPTWTERLGTWWTKWRAKPQVRSAALAAAALAQVSQGEVAPVPIIQGVASLLHPRKLVLIAADNQILDILTDAQQRQLHQRIIFEIATARWLDRRSNSGQALGSWQTWQALPMVIRPQWSFPVRAIYRLMGWVQCQSSAYPVLPPGISIPLGRATLPSLKGMKGMLQNTWAHLRSGRAVGLTAQHALALSPGSDPLGSGSLARAIGRQFHSYRSMITAVISAIALIPLTLALPARAMTAPALPMPLPNPISAEWVADPARTRKQWLKWSELFGSGPKPSQGKVRIAPEKTPQALVSSSFQSAITDWASRFSDATVSSGSPPIDVNAVFMGYHRHPLEWLLDGLDRVMAWFEIQLTALWQRGWPVVRNWFLH